MAVRQEHRAKKTKQAVQPPLPMQSLIQGPTTQPELSAPHMLQRAVTQPGRMTPGGMQMLQRAYGNRATTRLLPRSRARLPMGRQPLHLGSPGVIQRQYGRTNLRNERDVHNHIDQALNKWGGLFTFKSTRRTNATKLLSHTPKEYRQYVRNKYRQKFGENIVEPRSYIADTVDMRLTASGNKLNKLKTVGKTAGVVAAGAVALPLALSLGLPLALVTSPIWGYKLAASIKKKKRLKQAGKRGLHFHIRYDPARARDEVEAMYKANKKLLPLGMIRSFASNPKGTAWLQATGIGTPDKAEEYIEAGSFGDWENRKDYGFKLLVATCTWRMVQEGTARLGDTVLKNTPGYWKALSVLGRKAEIYARDEEMWEKTLQQPGQLDDDTREALTRGSEQWQTGGELLKTNAAALSIVNRIFIVLQKGLKYADAEGQWQEWKAPVAVALSHGGRVNIRIPKVSDPSKQHEFFNWLTGGRANMEIAGMHQRLAGTHRVSVGKDIVTGRETRKGSFRERQGFGAAIAAGMGWELGDTTHFGLDLPVGGLGQKDLHGDVILPNGRYGHLYIGYKPPSTTRDGALLIGCETDAPGKTNVLGHKHDWRAISAEFSSTGGAKVDKIGKGTGGMMVDLAEISRLERDWLSQLKLLERAVEEGALTSKDLVGKQKRYLQSHRR